jgi:DNA polymerase
MSKAADPSEPTPPTSLATARRDVAECRRCDLYKEATQAVFGEGSANAPLMLVGEQPGDREDFAGRPFVGPAGRVLDEALADAGITRDETYVTNAVKHFKFTPRGKRRIHQKPNTGEIAACRLWLDAERRLVRPRVIVALGATALVALFGRAATISSLRGQPVELDENVRLVATIHPSYLLRMDPADAPPERRRFTDDLRLARQLLATA